MTNCVKIFTDDVFYFAYCWDFDNITKGVEWLEQKSFGVKTNREGITRFAQTSLFITPHN